jgi:hypothetical protein
MHTIISHTLVLISASTAAHPAVVHLIQQSARLVTAAPRLSRPVIRSAAWLRTARAVRAGLRPPPVTEGDPISGPAVPPHCRVSMDGRRHR